MAKKVAKRIVRPATEEEKARHAEVRRRIAEELPELQARAKERLAEIQKEGVPVRQAIRALKAERVKQGLSLADLNARTGIDRAALSRLENNEDANPTLATLVKYADAVGKQLLVLLADR